MIYWTSPTGEICRAESENADMVAQGDGEFAAPYSLNSIIGQNLFHFIEGLEISHLYKALSKQVLKTGRAIHFTYRCDSPAIRREMTMRLSREAEMVRYESVLVRETTREQEIPRPTPDAETFVALCSFCQDYRFPTNGKVWKELESLLMETDLPADFQFTHGVCPQCYEIAMGKLRG